MTSWYSNILTKTSSQISSLRSTLLSSEADGDTEDDTHVCRVLRNYYTDKGRPRPAWLPADPKAPAPAPTPMYAQPQVGARYGGMQTSQAAAGGLSSLWDTSGGQQGPYAQPPQSQSLRAGRQHHQPPPPQQTNMLQPHGRDDVAPRPLPSQRSGSYQSVSSQSGGAAAGASSAQDRLKQRLRGGRATSPGPGAGPSPFQAPPAAGGGGGGGGMYGGDPYGGRGGGGGQRQGLPNGPRPYR
ncbi:hypothetical protein K4F52_007482 [Lecanicillium sp. MT-2017a]|nr:hypothetical protein K4F52_007482 [Lecanicillium sp. MT-2017a]